MRDVRTLVANRELRTAVERLVGRLGAVHVVSPDRWQPLIAQCFGEGLAASSAASESAAVLVGPPAFILKHAVIASDNFGVVMPVAQTSRPWQRAANWRDDATLGLWRLGWSPRALDRVLVPGPQSVVEFAIGAMRRTPPVVNQSATTSPHTSGS